MPSSPFVLRSAFFFLPLLAAGQDHLSPQQRAILASRSPAPVQASFSWEAPAGPVFTEAEKDAQRERGKLVLPMVRQAFASAAAEVRIPPGNYRFGQERHEGASVIFPLGFVDLQRDAEHPFVIDATGATFWFDLGDAQMPPGHRCVGFQNCRNLVFRGAILDRARGSASKAASRASTARQAILLRDSTAVTLQGNTLSAAENSMRPDAISQSPLLSLDGTTTITLEGNRLPDAPLRTAKAK